MSKGGRTSTTWEGGSTWRSGKTKLIRVPEAIADEVMRCAREIDAGKAVLHGNRADIVESAIADYIKMRQGNRHPNQHSKGKQLNTRSRTWDELRLFREWVENQDKLSSD
ncbi:hypothetical protein VF14_24565 [Nostoc linckia z18]|uniref:Uncharacterized protein n=2 Tax=Nostoc linckia TaxID=92942 RepID=A0A9Q6EIP4_NOSLI|nr:hypothetical protein [Nostoc linckia]PHK27730.1 hypothetical protein VF12_34290 [Nostoc linckia z15]PHK43378.1 hypothetical protein VF13_27395 [Nostoc linckia z16]PHJ57382.1 hypothetical protein VF02_30290 [Nostoc linckia z1]PHJ59996.1 hypothetical protein VF05_31095 [Nostoc linckia z3]PHJ64858.1 hypothetical protein VF03_28340 [Nostoc linckia z2]